MGGPLVRAVIVLSAAVGAFAVSASASTSPTLSFTTVGSGTWSITSGSGFTSGQNYSLSAISGILFPSMIILNDTGHNGTDTMKSDSCTSGTDGFNGSTSGAAFILGGSGSNETLTLYGYSTAVSLTGLTSGCNELLQLTGAFTGTYTSGTSGQFSFAGLSGVNYVNPTLLSDLGLTGDAATLLAGGGFNSTTGSGSGPITYTTNSEQMSFSFAPTPEPYSFGLAGIGILAVMLVARRKKSREHEAVAARADH